MNVEMSQKIKQLIMKLNVLINDESRCCYIKLEGIGHPHCTKISKSTKKYITEIQKEISESLDRNITIICYTKEGKE